MSQALHSWGQQVASACAEAGLNDVAMPGLCPPHVLAALQMHQIAVWDGCDESALQWISNRAGEHLTTSILDTTLHELRKHSFEVHAIYTTPLDRTTSCLCLQLVDEPESWPTAAQLPVSCPDKAQFVQLLHSLQRGWACVSALHTQRSSTGQAALGKKGAWEDRAVQRATARLAKATANADEAAFWAILCRALRYEAVVREPCFSAEAADSAQVCEGCVETAPACEGADHRCGIEFTAEVEARWSSAVAVCASLLRVDAVLRAKHATKRTMGS